MSCDCELVETSDVDCFYERKCSSCGYVWYSLHCPHDGVQHACPTCKKVPARVPLD